MTDSDDSDDDSHYEVNANLGSLHLCVSGGDPEWVDETFDAKLERLLEESEDISKALRDGTRSIS